MFGGTTRAFSAVLFGFGVTAAATANILIRDVVVVGGGAAGAHAAVWLRDHGKSVAVVEKREVLGGHTAAYEEPGTGRPINVGVQAWMEYKDTLAFVERMGVATNGSMQFANLTRRYVDFATGRPVPDYEAPADADKFAALERYLEVCEKYEDMLLPGFFDFPAPARIPEDLLLPFRDFVAKYNLSAAVPQMWQATAMGVGDTMAAPTLYVMQAVGVPMVRALLGRGAAVVPPSGRLQDLYDRIAAFLGDDVLYASTVAAAERRPDGVTVDVVGANGTTTRIAARRLLVAMAPTAANMRPLAPDAIEGAVWDTLQYTTVYAGLLRHPALAAGTSYAHTLPAAAAPANWTAYPLPPQLGRIDHVGGTADLFEFTAVGTAADTAAGMRAHIGRAVAAMRAAGTVADAPGPLAFPAFADHGPMHARVTADDLRAGFVQRQLALQGRKATWYTGAAFGSAFSTVLWAYNDVLLPRVIEGL